MEIKSPEELQKISDEGQEIFEEVALESAEFKSILSKLEDAAMDGYTGWYHKLTKDDDVRSYRVYEKALKEAGYEVVLDTKRIPHGLFPNVEYLSTSVTVFNVSWKK